MKKQLLIFLSILTLICCSKKEEIIDAPGKPLVKIGEITITKDEFIKRAEYTIRPVYCKDNLNIHKKIVLNSLIAEKLMALEVDGDSIVMANNQIKNYLKGRKEQVMRELLYYNEGTKKVELDKEEIATIYNNAGKTYQLIFVNFPNVSIANEFLDYINKENISFEEAVKVYTQKDELPIQEMTYEGVKNKEIHDILYKSTVDKSKIYGPIKMLSENAVLFKIATWKDSKVITDEQIKLRHNDIVEKATRIKADEIYTKYVHEIMAGKTMDFNRDTFIRLASLYSELYNIKKSKKKEMFNKEMWGTDPELQKIDSLSMKFNDLKNAILLNIDGENWTVGKFQQELQSHPLVFRKDKISGYEFPNQFRLAIADMIRDKYITENAYAKGYNDLVAVKNQTAMWQDNITANFYRDKYLYEKGFDGNFDSDFLSAINDFLNPLVDSLQNKYSDQIFINTEMFNEIQLTRIDLFAMQQSVPYPIVSPSFPILTTDNKLDYGNKMKKTEK